MFFPMHTLHACVLFAQFATIDIEELKTKIDLENTEKDPPKYTELFATA